jgi:hypothetical protein
MGLLSLAALILLALPATHLRFIQRGEAKRNAKRVSSSWLNPIRAA